MSNTATPSLEAPLRVPPHSVEAERGVIGSILLDAATENRVMDLCTESGITPEAFFTPAFRLIFETLTEMTRANLAIDSITLTERLRATKRLEDAGGTDALQALLDATPTAAHAEYYINILRQKYLLRMIMSYARDAERRCFEDAASADLILSEVEQRFLGLSDRNAGAGLTWKQALNNTMAHIERIFSLGAGAVAGLPTGFRNLDKKLKGLRNGEMIVLAARPSVGKTSLAMNIAECVALGKDIYGRQMKGDHNRKHAVGVFSLEMSNEALAMRMLCGHARVPGWKLDAGMGSGREITTKLTRSISELSTAPFYIDDTSALEIMEMRARARRMKKRYNIELIVIDYLQLCNCREFTKQGLQVETSQISANIKAMAKELNLPVIVLSQLSRANERRGDKTEKPKLSDLRDSGAIEQDADVVLLLRRPSRTSGDPEHDDERLAIVDVAKHRNGPTGEVRLDFDGEITRFGDRTDTAQEFADAEPEP